MPDGVLRQARASLVALTFGASLLATRPAPCAEPEALGRPLPAQSSSGTERRRIFVGVVGFLALVLGGVGLFLVRRNRRQSVGPGPGPEPEPAPGPTVATVAQPTAGVVMVCPTCRQEFESDARYCKFDGNRLVGVQDGVELRGPTGGICPTCGHGFDPGVATCPSHGDELVPWALCQRDEDDGEDDMRKICPVCGSQYLGSSGFCGADGTALETVN
jgi:hypothetical protein